MLDALLSQRLTKVLAACALLAATACSGSFEEVRAPFHTSISSGPSPLVTITNVVGEVRVKPSDAGVVDIAATKYASNQTELANVDIIARTIDGGISVETKYRGEHAGGVRYDITVPRDASLRITNTIGSVKIAAVNGSVVAHTVTGTIDARLGRVASNRSVDLKSGTGTIDLHIAGDSSANVTASSALGSISSDFTAVGVNRNNLVGSTAAGRIGGGTATIRLSVGTGSISMERD